MTHIEGTFNGSGGFNLYYQSWQPEVEVQAIVAIVHGLGAHSGLFDSIVQYLTQQGYAVYAFDLRGHGRSPGQRGHINAWSEFREDLHTFLLRVQERGPSCACFLWGHSLGAVIALDYALHFPESLQGLILTAPAIGKVRIPRLKVALGLMLSGILPRFSLRLSNKQKHNRKSSTHKVLTPEEKDPLRHEYGSARLAREYFATEKWVQDHACDLQVPLLILHGSTDRVIPPESSFDFFQRVCLPDKKLYVYPGDYHDLHQEFNYQDILSDLGEWLEQHLSGGSNAQSVTCAIKVPTLQSETINIE
ncbi:MAG: alpha/beta hydrolase [Nostocaceae cyanobacterium]|nr:alpha/beta hydrolase [Nostocaceae cyanobacterium]